MSPPAAERAVGARASTPFDGPPAAAAGRTLGVALGAGLLGGFVDGPVMAVVGAMALIVTARSLLEPWPAAVLEISSVTVFGIALGVGALRWGAVTLEDVRGIQAVLGPTLATGPPTVATACALGAGASVVAIAIALTPPAWALPATLLWSLEVAAGALAIAIVYWGPAIGGEGGWLPEGSAGVGLWFVTTAGVAVFVGLLSAGLARLPLRVRWGIVAAAGAAAAAGSGLVASGM